MVNTPPPTRRIEKSQADLRLMQVREQIGTIVLELRKLTARPDDALAVATSARLNEELVTLRQELFAAMSSTDKLK